MATGKTQQPLLLENKRDVIWSKALPILTRANDKGISAKSLAVAVGIKPSHISPMLTLWYRAGAVNVIDPHTRPRLFCLPTFAGISFAEHGNIIERKKRGEESNKAPENFLPRVDIKLTVYVSNRVKLEFHSLEEVQTLHAQLSGILRGFGVTGALTVQAHATPAKDYSLADVRGFGIATESQRPYLGRCLHDVPLTEPCSKCAEAGK